MYEFIQTFRTNNPTETSTKTHAEIPVEKIKATYANGTQLHCKKGENTGSLDPCRDGFLAGYVGIFQCLFFILT